MRKEVVMDTLIGQILLERLGHVITGMIVYLGREEMEYVRWRNEAEEILQKKE